MEKERVERKGEGGRPERNKYIQRDQEKKTNKTTKKKRPEFEISKGCIEGFRGSKGKRKCCNYNLKK